MVEYYEKWFRPKRRFLRPLTSAEAIRRDAEGVYYVAHFSEPQPAKVLDVVKGWLSVYFLDQLNRAVLSIDLREIGQGRAFISRSISNSYIGETDDIEHSTILAFGEGGTCHSDRLFPDGKRIERVTSVSVENHFVSIPDFGKFDEGWFKRIEAVVEVALRTHEGSSLS